VEQFLQEQQKAGDTQKSPPAEMQAEPAEREKSTSVTPPQPEMSTKSVTSGQRQEERVRMSRRRRPIAQRLLEAKQNTAMLTTFNEIDMGVVMDLRKRRNEEFQKRHDIKLGFMSFFVKAAISALKAFPQVNAEIDGEEIVFKQYYDIGMAIGAEEGLVVPVIREADRLSFADIEKQIKDFVAKTQQGKLTVEDLRGGTFTITNGGVFGSLLSTPILNPPQVGILGLHKIEDRPIAQNGQIVIRPMMYVALSYDHRIVDGREAVQFLVHIKQLLEDPAWMLVEG
jgi:2-oxoglutarate dehydrogenase E2 component (dihydrolipoamide succinyltransferase)